MMQPRSEAARFRNYGVAGGSQETRAFLQRKLGLDDNGFDAIATYLTVRAEEVSGKDTFGIVYDVTRVCNLECAHCCVSAIFTPDPGKARFETTTGEVRTILSHVHDYTSHRGFPNVFLIFGGGEPTLRPDFAEIAFFARDLFGQQGVGVNTNGTVVTVEELKALSPALGFIEVSVDGLEDNHNAWRDPRNRSGLDNPYQRSMALIEEAVKDEEIAAKLEVSSAVTTDNIDELRTLAEQLAEIGVRQYSIHRAMPVGRMGRRLSKIPSMEQYARLFLDVAWLRENTSLKTLHVHHSLESIYSALFIGRDIHASDLLTGSARHSIGLDPRGNVYFDPWCIVAPYNKLAAGNLLDADANLSEIIEREGSLIQLADEISRTELRCRGCRVRCSGGMRFNALGYYLSSRLGERINAASEPELIAGLSEIDPACPLFEP